MTTCIALLRAVNLGAHNPVAMADLRVMAARLGLGDPRTVVQSGNLVFRAPARSGTVRLERELEAAAKEQLGLDTDFFVRDAAEWNDLVAGNPFPREAAADPGRLVVLLCKAAPAAAAVAALQAAIRGREVVRGGARHVYAFYPDGQGRSRLTIPAIERKLGARVTGRNWNTVLKLLELARSPG